MDYESMAKEQLIEQIKEMTKLLEVKNNTESKETGSKNIINEEIWHTFFELAPDGCYVCDLSGIFVTGNKAAEEITGYSREELVGKSFLEVDLISSDQKISASAGLALNAQGLPSGPDEFTLKRKDGSKVVVETKSYPVKIEGKTHVLGIAREISERKKTEEKLNEYREQLEELVHRQAYELQKFSERLAAGQQEDE